MSRLHTKESKAKIAEAMRQSHLKRKALKEEKIREERVMASAKAVQEPIIQSEPEVVEQKPKKLDLDALDSKYGSFVDPAPPHALARIPVAQEPEQYNHEIKSAIVYEPIKDSLESENKRLREEIEVLKYKLSLLPSNPAWDGNRLTILLPWYKETNPVTALCMAASAKKYGEKIGFRWCFGDAVIAKSRNNLADQLLSTQSEWGLFLDDDMVFPVGNEQFIRSTCHIPNEVPGNLFDFDAIDRMVRRGQKVIGALYFQRNSGGNPCFDTSDQEVFRMSRDPNCNGVFPVRWVGTGFMLVHRSIFEEMREKMPELAPGITETKVLDENGQEITERHESQNWGYFNHIGQAGEDVSFCTRVRAMGHRVCVDFGVRAFHIGRMVYGEHNTTGKAWK